MSNRNLHTPCGCHDRAGPNGLHRQQRVIYFGLITPRTLAMTWPTTGTVIESLIKSSIYLVFISFANLKHILVGLKVVTGEAQQLWDGQALGVGRHEEGKAPMAPSWNEAIYPKLD